MKMFSSVLTLYLLLFRVDLLSSNGLSPVNGNNNQHQLQITNKLVNQLSTIERSMMNSTDIKWIKSLKNITEYRGRPMFLECQVKSSQPVRFHWYRYNNPIDRNRFLITENPFRSSIRLKNPKDSMAGFYTCEVSNNYQRLSSTGFVRVKNSNGNSMDISDDLLPSVEFQPEIIASNEQSIEQLKCEIYKGDVCRAYLGSKYVSMGNVEIEENLIDNLQIVSKKCQEFLLPMICLFVYPICDEYQNDIRSICRKSCFYYQNHSCMREFSYLHNLPTCDNLPPSSDDQSCLKIHLYRNVSSSDDLPSIFDQFFMPFNGFPMVVLSIVLPIIFICLLISIICCCYYYRNGKRAKDITKAKNESAEKFLSPFHPTVHRNIAVASSTSSTNTNHRPLTEIPFGNIRLVQEIGEGEFGRVYFGELIDNNSKCVIKALENEEIKHDYFREVEVFRHIHHVNISNLVGICRQPENALSLVLHEYFSRGDLHEYLTDERTTSIDLFDFLHMSTQIASGMNYLSEKNFLHNDLSARNIFISENLTIKISNLARCRRKYHSNYYKLTNRLLPVRWMSIESLLNGIYSEMSDVWSFGVLLWEMFSYGIQPYQGYTSPEVIEMIRDRKLLTCPDQCPKRIYTLMCSCWEENSDQRPTFNELVRKFKQFQERSKTLSIIEKESISNNPLESPTTTTTYRTFAKTPTQSLTTDRNSFRFHV